ncbi:MAG: hypothetical protein RIR33_508 [Pseudomonadota bacterium]|jgi:hypothetical protein
MARTQRGPPLPERWSEILAKSDVKTGVKLCHVSGSLCQGNSGAKVDRSVSFSS